MAETDWWKIFTRTGCVEDYLSYRGALREDTSMQSENRNIGERAFESVSNGDRDDTVRSTYR